MPGYREFAPQDALAAFVECYWAATGSAAVHEVRPDGCIDLLLDGARAQASRLVGAMTQAVLVSGSAGGTVLGVRFRPGGAHALLGLPMDELTDRAVPLADLDAPLRELGARVGDAADQKARILAIEGFLLARRPLREDAIGRALRALEGAQGQCRIDALAAGAGASRQWFTRCVRERTGLAPKLLARILRLRGAVASRRRGESLAALALRCGYADQAHLARDARALFGVAPSVF